MRTIAVLVALVVILVGGIALLTRRHEPSLSGIPKGMAEAEVKGKYGRPDNVVSLPSSLYDAKNAPCRTAAVRALVYYRHRKLPAVIYLDNRAQVACVEEHSVF